MWQFRPECPAFSPTDPTNKADLTDPFDLSNPADPTDSYEK